MSNIYKSGVDIDIKNMAINQLSQLPGPEKCRVIDPPDHCLRPWEKICHSVSYLCFLAPCQQMDNGQVPLVAPFD